jgi:hypothetical protein
LDDSVADDVDEDKAGKARDQGLAGFSNDSISLWAATIESLCPGTILDAESNKGDFESFPSRAPEAEVRCSSLQSIPVQEPMHFAMHPQLEEDSKVNRTADEEETENRLRSENDTIEAGHKANTSSKRDEIEDAGPSTTTHTFMHESTARISEPQDMTNYTLSFDSSTKDSCHENFSHVSSKDVATSTIGGRDHVRDTPPATSKSANCVSASIDGIIARPVGKKALRAGLVGAAAHALSDSHLRNNFAHMKSTGNLASMLGLLLLKSTVEKHTRASSKPSLEPVISSCSRSRSYNTQQNNHQDNDRSRRRPAKTETIRPSLSLPESDLNLPRSGRKNKPLPLLLRLLVVLQGGY